MITRIDDDGYYFNYWVEDTDHFYGDWNFPVSRYADHFAFLDYGKVVFFDSDEDRNSQSPEWKIEILTKDKIRLYSYHTEKTYILTRI